MTKIDKPHVRDRITTIDDERKRVLDLYDMTLVPPEVGIFDEPTRCYIINKEWAKIVMGMVSWLADVAPWHEAENEGYDAIDQIAKFIEGDNCGDCSIEDLLADEDFLVNDYLPTQFGLWASDTNAEIADLESDYTGTPQSVAPDVPIGTPLLNQQIALCYALTRFVELYASQKLCAVQSKNFLEMSWTRISNAANFVWNGTANLLAGTISIELFDCLISDAAAITALNDVGAAEELACFLFDELKGTSMSLTAFNNAIEAAVTDLTGNAMAIACLMQGDNDLSTYLLFLKAYNIALRRKLAGEELECPCEIPTTYWMLYLDFRGGNRQGTVLGVWNGAPNDGLWGGAGYEVNKTPVVTTLNAQFVIPSLGGLYVTRAWAMIAKRRGSDGNGSNDTANFLGFAGENGTGTLTSNAGTGFITGNTDDVISGTINAIATATMRSMQFRARVNQRTDTPPAELNIHQAVIWGLPDALGTKPPTSVWGGTLPGTVPGLFK